MLAVGAGGGGSESVGGMRRLVRSGFDRRPLPNQIAVFSIKTEEFELQFCQCGAASSAGPAIPTRLRPSLWSPTTLSPLRTSLTARLPLIAAVSWYGRDDKDLISPDHG
jgi:hypothetical protein